MSSQSGEYNHDFGLTPAQYHGQLDRLWKALGATKGPNGEDVFTLAIQAIEQARCKVSSIPGLNFLAEDGFEIVRYDFVSPGECYVGHDGTIWKWDGLGPSAAKHIIIRKIEKPRQYRPFANAAEAETLWDAKLQFKGHDADRFRVTAIRSTGVTIGGSTYRYEEAFEQFECSDGTPFGVEVTE